MKSSGDCLVTTSTCPCYIGDPQPRFVLDLASSLVPHFNRVHLLAPGAPGAAGREEIAGVFIHRFQYTWPASLQHLCYRHGIMQNIRANPLLLTLLPLFYSAQVRAVTRLCDEFPIEVINSHWFVFQSMAAARATRQRPVRHVAHSHGADLDLLHRLPTWLSHRILAAIVNSGTKMVCESNYVRGRLDSLLGHPSGAAVSCMGVDTTAFKPVPTGDRYRILFVGRLVEKKGVAFLLKAMPLVRKQIPEVVLEIVGDGEQATVLRTLSAELGLDRNVIVFSGARPHAEVAAALASARVIVVPSVMDRHGEVDGMPTVLLEAMASGKRVVGTRVDGIPDVLKHGENGWMCEPADEAALAGQLISALQDTDERIPLAARKTTEHYNWPVLAARYAALLLIRS